MLKYGLPQGSLLGPLFYILYTKDIENIVQQHGLQLHMYADDCQIYISFQSGSCKQSEKKLSACLSIIKKWMDKNFLKLNPNKTNLILLNSKSNLPDNKSLNLKFNNCVVSPSESIKALGVTLTESLHFNSFIAKKVQICSFHLKNLFHMKNSLPLNIRVILVTNLVLSNIDYCNSLLFGATDKDLKPLQRIINRAVRFIFDLKKRDHTSLFMFKLHFLPIKYRIIFKVCLIAFKIVHNLSPDYLSDGFEIFQPTTSINLRIG